jgi:uncharacterized peroxidase-related enzyme
MAHIELGNDAPGIRGLFAYRPQTAGPISDLVETLLRGEGTLARGERELIAAYVSHGNGCRYCTGVHGACAAAQLPGGSAQVAEALAGPEAAGAAISPKLRALLRIADLVRQDGRLVTGKEIAAARAEGATDLEIHDTVLIAAMFAMFNRYVDGLATFAPEDPAYYTATAQRLIQGGYAPPR